MVEEPKKEGETPKEELKEKTEGKPEEKPPEEKKEEAKQEKPLEFDAKAKHEELAKAVEELAGKVSMITEALDKLVEEEEEEVKEMNEVKPPEGKIAEVPVPEGEAKYSKEIAELNSKVESMEKQLAQFSLAKKKTLSSDQNVQIEESDAIRNLRIFMER